MSDYLDYFMSRITPTNAITPPPTPAPIAPEVRLPTVDEAESRFRALQQASQNKISQLTARRDAQLAVEKAQRESLAGQMLLPEGSTAFEVVNAGAEIYSGTSRVVGQLATIPPTLRAALAQGRLTEQDIASLERHTQGVATAEDLVQINRKTTPNPNSSTPLTLWTEMNEDRGTARMVTESFDRSDLVHQRQRDAFSASLAAGYDPASSQIGDGFEKFGDGGVVGGSADIVSGIAQLLFNAGTAAGSNKRAAVGYMLENAPQLALGAAGKGGAGLMAASNLGYAADVYNQGIENYQAKNNGALPPEDVRQQMAFQAATLMAAEQVGDMAALGIAKVRPKAVDSTRATFKSALLDTGKAGGKGFLTEAPTEGFQTYMEGQITGEEASGLDIYTGAVIGGVSGAGLAGGGRGVGEAARLASQPSLPKNTAPADPGKDAAVAAAIDTGDVSALVDPTKKGYAPDAAVRALRGHSKKDPAAGEANLAKADEILADLVQQKQFAEMDLVTPEATQAEIDKLESRIASTDPTDGRLPLLQAALEDEKAVLAKPKTPEQLEATRKKIARIDKMIGDTTRAREELSLLVQPKVAIEAMVTQANESADPVVAEKVITLAMRSPGSLTPEQATQMAGNMKNGFTEAQRGYLRVLSEARIAENKLIDIGGVSEDIYFGRKNKGIVQYQAAMSAALSRGNERAAENELAGISKFAKQHTNKAATVAEAMAIGPGTQILRTKAGEWVIGDGSLAQAELTKNGGLKTFKKATAELASNIKAEADALTKAAAEMRAAYDLKFSNGAPNVTNKSQPAQGKEKQAQPEVAPVQDPGAVGQGSGTVDKGVVRPVAAKPTSVEAAGVDLPAGTKFEDLTDPEMKLNLYRGEGPGNAADGGWWSFDEDYAEKYAKENNGTVKQIVMTVKEIASTSAQGHGNVRNRVFPGKIATGGDSVSSVEAESTESSEKSQVSEVTEKSESTQSKEPIAEENQSTAENNTAPVEPQAAEPTGGLEALTQKSPEGTSFKLRNLLADYFSQSVGSETAATKRPLVMVKDFLSNLSVNVAEEFLGFKPEGKKLAMLKLFKSTAREWDAKFKRNLVRSDNPEYYFKDLMQFLVQGEGKALDLEENVKAAMTYAAISVITEQAARPQYNTPEDINAILQRDDKHPVDDAEQGFLGDVGTREAVLINLMGQRALQALGFKSVKGAPADLMARMESAIGGHIFKTLHDEGILERNMVPGPLLDDLMGNGPDYSQLPSDWAAQLMDMTYNAERLKKARKAGLPLGGLPEKDAKAVQAAFDKLAAASDTTHAFLKLAADEDGVMHPKVLEILEATRGTQNVLDKLFAVEPGLKEPTHEPTKYTQSKTKNAAMDVPDVAKPVLQSENDVASYVHPGMWQFASIVDNDTLKAIAGAEHIDGKHVTRVPGIEAKNDALQREITHFKDFVRDMMTDGKPDSTKPMFFDHIMWLVQRVGIATNLINPQTSKVHRHMMYRKAWDTEITIADGKQMEGFYLRVGEGLGVKTDKQGNPRSLVDSLAKIEAVSGGVDALVRMLQNPGVTTMSAEDQQAVMDAAAKGGEGMHSLAALMAIAQYKVADAAKQKTFNTQLMGEVDGVTNGPMLSHLLLGAAETVEDWFSLLNKGGFFEQGNKHTQYNLYREDDGNFDLYETTTGHMDVAVKQLINEGITNQWGTVVMSAGERGGVALVMNAIYGFTGELVDKNGTVKKAGRNIIKTPLTAMVFGSSVSKAVQSMADKFVGSIYTGIEDTAAGEKNALSREDLIENLNVLLSQARVPMISPNTTIETLLKRPLTKEQITGIQWVFKNTLGKAVRSTMEQDFGVFLARRKTFNDAAQLTHGIYDAAYRATYNQVLNEQMDLYAKDPSQGVPFREVTVGGKKQTDFVDGRKVTKTVGGTKVREPLHDLPADKMAWIRNRLKDLTPIMHSAMSKESGQLSAGLYIGKKDRKLSTNPAYKNKIKFGFGVKGTEVWSKIKNAFVPQTSVAVTSYEMVASSPGVSMSPVSTHSADTAAMHKDMFDALNVHDARGIGVGGFTQAAKTLNKNLWGVMLNYSPASEMYDALSRTVRGFAAEMDKGLLPPEAVKNMVEALYAMAQRDEFGPEFGPGMLRELITNAKDMAFKADDMKFHGMSMMESVDQYALEGGNYTVSETDRSAAAAKRAKLTKEVDAATLKAIETIEKALKAEMPDKKVTPVVDIEQDTTPAPEKKNPFGELGTPAVKPDPEILAFFQKNPKTTAKHVFALLNKLFEAGTLPNSAFNLQLVKMIRQVIDPKLELNLITKNTKLESIVGDPEPGAHGWITFKGATESIYALSPEFVDSGLNAELLLHELTHAALVRKIRDGSPEVKPYVDELKALYKQAKDHVEGLGMVYTESVSSLDEFLAHGMTNLKFQQDVLINLTFESKTEPMNGLQAFIKKISGILFRGWGAKPQINNGMTALISNVTSIVELAKKNNSKGDADITLAMAAPAAGPVDKINAYSTMDILHALDNGTLDQSFQAHLGELLGGIVEKLHGPFGAFKEAMRKTEAGNPLAVWLKALETGKAPFASAILASGFTGNSQQDFVMEQVEATVRAAINSNEALTKEAYRELTGLYTETQARLTWKDFLGGQFHTNTQTEAQAVYDFVFKLEKSNGDRSDYLARFAALGLGHQGFNKLLQVNTEMGDPRAKPKTFVERLEQIFADLLSWGQRRITNTYKGQRADAKLTSLVDQLVDIEAKKRHALARDAASGGGFMDPVEDSIKKVADKGMDKLVEMLKSPKIKDSGNAFVKAAGSLARTVAGNRVDHFVQAMVDYRNAQFEGQLGIIAGTINSIKGPTEKARALLMFSKKNEKDRMAQITLKSKYVLQSFVNEGVGMGKTAKAAISAVFLRTGAHHLLDNMSLAEIEAVLDDKVALDAAIAQYEAKLAPFGKLAPQFIYDANALGWHIAIGGNRSPELKLNAYQIAHSFGSSNTLTDAQRQQAIDALSPLISLYAMRFTPATKLAEAKKVMRAENARSSTEPNGVEFTLRLQKHLEAESMAKLFDGKPALMIHGFTPEIYNYRTDLKVANEVDGKELEYLGYVKGAEIQTDPADPDQETKHFYRMADGGMSPHLTGVMGLDGRRAKGTKIHSGYQNPYTITGANNQSTNASINAHRRKAKAAMANLPPNRDLSKDKGQFMAPVYNEQGTIISWRYLMAESTKDVLLERDNDFDTIMGTLAGSIESKVSTVEQNRLALTTMLEQYESEYASRGEQYVNVGPKSESAELREIWDLLPDETKQDAKTIWGRDGIMVRNDALDIMFGYRKLSAADMFKDALKERDERGLDARAVRELASLNYGQMVLVSVVEWVLMMEGKRRGMNQADADNFSKRAAMLVSKSENVWQEVVKEAKDLIVVKTGITMVGNIFSNFTMLWLQGVPVKDMIANTLVAFKGATLHRADTAEMDFLKTQLATGQVKGQEAQTHRRIAVLEDAIARNPVTALIEAGLMPTIVEDIAAEDDIYSYKSALTRKVEGLTSKLNPGVVSAARTVYMAHDTKLYRGLSHVTQLSDFVARYTLYQHQTTRKKNPLTQKEALMRASDAFVNYDIPMHRSMQYSDDMGFTMFTKYFLYIQKELFRVAKENPARVYSMLTLSQFMNLGPIVLDSSLFANFGDNPVRNGAFAYPNALDKLMTVEAAMAVVK